MQHVFDGGVQKLGNVVGEFVVHAGRKRFLLELLEVRLDFLNDGGGVGAGSLLENDGARRVTIDVRVNVEHRRAQLDSGNVLEPQDLPLGIGLQNDVFILLRFVVTPDPHQDVLA